MRQLFPEPLADVVPHDVYGSVTRAAPRGRPWLLLNMVSSLDGGTAVDGRSGGLGGEADRTVFSTLRSLADVILVAAGTVRTEQYGPPRAPVAFRAARSARNQAPYPRIAVVTSSLDLDPTTPLFTEADERPLVLSTEDADPARSAALAEVAEVVTVGDTSVDLAAAMAALGDRGAGVVLCEGGPSLNGQLLAADLVDEVCLTVAPSMVGGSSSRVAHSMGGGSVATFRLGHVLEAGGALFLRSERVR